jgi:RNA polymerase sigma factor (sigma-70 family)
MARMQAAQVLRQIRRLAAAAGEDDLTDQELLRRFVAGRDETAFAALVRRHGAMVLNTCRRVLRHAQDAEDAFQAAFLVLARKAATLRRGACVGGWLYQVAYRLALRARADAGRRRCQQQPGAAMPADDRDSLTFQEVRAALDEELQRLAERHRAPLVLCYLEGHTQDEAARRLGWSKGTLRRRLEHGRALLRARLLRRGVTLGAALCATELTQGAAAAAVPASVAAAAVRAGVLFATGAGPVAATRPALLAGGMLQAMLASRLRLGALALVVLSCVAGLATQGVPASRSEGEPAAAAPAAPQPAAGQQARRDLQGDPLPAEALARLGTVRLRHKTMVASGVFTRDGKTAIVGDGDGNIVYWDVATGRATRRLQGPRGVVYALAISADGKTLASGGWGHVSLWEVATGKLLSRGKVVNDSVTQLLFTPDGKTLALRCQGDTVYLYDTAQKRTTHALKGHTGNVACIALSPDGKTLASGSWKDPHIRLWEVSTGKERFRFVAHASDVIGIAFSPDGKTLASSGNIGSHFWDAATGKRLRKTPCHLPPHFAYFPDGKTLVGIDGGGFVHVYDAGTGKPLRKYDAPPRSMAQLAISADGKAVMTFWGGAHTFDLWDAAAGKPLLALPGHRHWLTSLAFTDDGRTLFSAAGISDLALAVWDVRTGARLGQLGDNPNGVQGLALSPDGKLLAACGYSDNTIRLWDAAARKEVRTFKGHTSVIVSVAWSADGKTLVSGSQYDKTIRLWDAEGGRERRVIKANQDWPADVALSPDGKVIAAGGYQDGTVRRWSAATGKELRPLPGPPGIVYTVAFSPDGAALAAAGTSGDFHLYDAATGRLLRRWAAQAGWVGQLAFAADGRSLVSGDSDGSVRLWEVGTGEERACFKGHEGSVRAVAFSRDGRRVASGSEDTSVLVWDVTGGARPDAALSAERLQGLWADLAGADAARAHRAAWQLALSPRHSLPFLRERLRPVAPTDAGQRKRIAGLLAELGSERFAVRERARAELEKLGAGAEPALREALEGDLTLEVRNRIENLLARVAGRPTPGSPARPRVPTGA